MRPKVVLSKCFCEPVRYNGEIINDGFVNKLKKYVDYINFCPEVDIGLGIPRKNIIIVKDNGSKRLIQYETGIDLTEKIIRYSEKVVNSLNNIDGFLLKAKSPSCGVGTTKLYKNEKVIGKTYGIFAEKIKEKFYYLPIEDEVRLRDKDTRQHFLTRIFAFSDLRELIENKGQNRLIDFHRKYKYLIMAYSYKCLKKLEKFVTNERINIEEKINGYKEKFYQTFLKKTFPKRHFNTLLHIIEQVSNRLNLKERRDLISLLENYKKGKIQLEVIIEMLKSLSTKFEDIYPFFQKYIQPYPEELNI